MFSEATPKLLQAICEETGWQVGLIWRVDVNSQVLCSGGLWHRTSDDQQEWDRLYEQYSFRKGEGLPGRVWEARTPLWIKNLASDPSFPRQPVAAQLGLQGGFAFPIPFHDEILGVMEFFSEQVRKPDTDLLQMMLTAGRQIGLAMERWRSEENLRESEERYRIVGDTATDGIFTIDQEDVIRYANPSAERIFGYGSGELLGKLLTDLIPERYRSRHLDGIRHYSETETPRIGWSGVTLPGLQRSGQEIPLELSFGVYKKRNGEFFFTGIARDISERVRTEKEKAMLLESEKAARLEATLANEAKDQFLATLSHEMRTPMTAILGWSRMLAVGGLDEETLAMAVDAIQKSAKAQAQLIEDVLDVSRIVAGKVTLEERSVRLPTVIQSAVDMIMPSVEEKRISLVTHIDASVPPILGDQTRLQQILWNLVGNAVKFTPEEGQIEVRLDRGGTSARVQVRDSGQGMDKDFLPHVFERFRQAEQSTTRSYGGLGLGLAIVKHLVELHGGSISADSEGPGKGSTFTVLLPVDRAVTRAVTGNPSGAREAQVENAIFSDLTGVRALVVDDDSETRTLVDTVLSRCGAEVDHAADAETALQLVDENDYDVVISDIAMPRKDGFFLIEKIRSRDKNLGSHLPCLALTASAIGKARELTLAAGFDDYRRKPIEPVDLALVVRQIAQRSRKHR